MKSTLKTKTLLSQCCYACYHCGKAITTEVMLTNPPNYLLALGLDFPKAFHPPCYANAELEAARELNQK